MSTVKNRKERAAEWKRFREEFMFTQLKLADLLGISRRTVQQIEAGNIDPHLTTLHKFSTFKRKHEQEKDRSMPWQKATL